MLLSGLSTEARIFDTQTAYLAVKAGSVVIFVFYIIFAFVIVKQVNKMTDTLEVGFESQLRFLALLHLLLSIGALLVSLVVL